MYCPVTWLICELRREFARDDSRFVAKQESTHEDMEALDAIKMLLGKDTEEVERDLTAGIVKKSILEKKEIINGDLVGTFLAHIPMNPLVQEL